MFKKTTILKLVLASILIIQFFSSGLGVSAQDNSGLVVSPAKSELKVERGQSYTVEILVENDTFDKQYNLEILTQTFKASPQEGVPEIQPLLESDVFGNWISYSEDSFELSLNAEKVIDVTLDIPEDAAPGGYYYAVTFADDGGKSFNENNQVRVESRVVALIFIEVQGQIQREVEIETFATDNNFYDPFYDPIFIEYKISTTGNSYFLPSGNLYYSDDGEIRNQAPINPNQKIILPDSDRNFKAVFKPSNKLFFDPEKDLEGQILDVQMVNEDHKWFGSQDLELRVVYINSNQELARTTATVKVFFFPWRAALGASLIIIIVTILFYYIRKRRKSTG